MCGSARVMRRKTSTATTYSTQGTPSSNGLALEAIPDGTSNTIMFMETNGGYLDGLGDKGCVIQKVGNGLATLRRFDRGVDELLQVLEPGFRFGRFGAAGW